MASGIIPLVLENPTGVVSLHEKYIELGNAYAMDFDKVERTVRVPKEIISPLPPGMGSPSMNLPHFREGSSLHIKANGFPKKTDPVERAIPEEGIIKKHIIWRNTGTLANTPIANFR